MPECRIIIIFIKYIKNILKLISKVDCVRGEGGLYGHASCKRQRTQA
jgi:hypothetical protein